MKKKTNVIVALVLLTSLFLVLIFLKNKKDNELLDYSKNYQQEENLDENSNDNEVVYCTQDVTKCPDGTYVGRVPPDCKFKKCPIPIIEKK